MHARSLNWTWRDGLASNNLNELMSDNTAWTT